MPASPHNRPAASSLFASPRLFHCFSSTKTLRFLKDPEAAMSPTSILESNPSSSPKAHSWGGGGCTAIGLGIVDAISNDVIDKKSSNLENRRVLFGAELKIQIPTSPIEFGIKTKSSQLALHSPAWRSQMGTEVVDSSSPRVMNGCSMLSPSEMELSEDYTCVISHGPNPKTTHIFDNCVVKSCGVGPFIEKKIGLSENSSEDLLSFCCACKKDLGSGKKSSCTGESFLQPRMQATRDDVRRVNSKVLIRLV